MAFAFISGAEPGGAEGQRAYSQAVRKSSLIRERVVHSLRQSIIRGGIIK